LIVFVLSFDLAFLWQRVGGAYASEFGGHPDEAAHYVTGLFIRDSVIMVAKYGAAGFHGSPIKVGKDFADSYYAHYPKISLGVWPPFFYVVQSAWTLPFSPVRTSILLLMCALAATVSVLLFRPLRDEFGVVPAAFGAALFLSLPLVRSYYSMVMAEMLSTALIFGATLAFGNFLDREKRSDAVWFGVLAALAILTKGTGLALALAVPLAMLFTRRFHVLRRPSFWLAVVLIVVVAGPWTFATRNLGRGGWEEPSPSWHFTLLALRYYPQKLALALCVLPLVFLAIGVWVKSRAGTPHQGRWASAGGLIVAIMIFQSILPVGLESRHLIAALPAAIMFIVAGMGWKPLGSAEPPEPRRLLPWINAALMLAITAGLTPLAAKNCRGFAPVAETLLSEATPSDVALVSSDARGEGMFISEVAMREHRPGHMIQRASKSLASSTWSGSGYSPLYENDDDLLAFLTSGKIQYLVLDDSVPDLYRRAHEDQLKRVIDQHADSFWEIARSEIVRDGELQAAQVKLFKIRRRN
jgi:hypothetical protein